MRLIRQRIEKRDGSGTATLLPEESEDMWHAYNLIQQGDLLTASAVRRVVTESATGGTSSARVHTKLTLRVKKTDFDVGASQLHVLGQVAAENAVVKLGSFHTLDLELQRQFTLEKADGWDSIALQVLRDAVDQSKRAELWAVMLQDGLANIVLMTEHQTIFKQRVEVPIPRKRIGRSSEQDKATERFFDTLLSTLLRHVDLSLTQPKPLLLASPGFTAGAFQSYIKKIATQTSNKQLQNLASQIILAHSSSGHMHSLAEVLSSKAVIAKIADTKYSRETMLMDSLFTILRKDDGRAWYGPREVERAVDKGAVGRGGGILLISNALFRSQDITERKRWVSLVDRVKDREGGEVRVLSSLHESGKRLEGLGNIAAILTFPLEDLDESDNDMDNPDTDGRVDNHT